MKKSTFLLFILFFSFFVSNAQYNEWTWIKGSSTAADPGNYGTMGVEASTNCPPAGAEGYKWIDKNGNFWYYGGFTGSSFSQVNTMWKYNPSTNNWTWMRGVNSATSLNPVYGIKKTPAANNDPGGMGFGGISWTDTSGNLWLFGDNRNALWKYDISTNIWTWISGTNGMLKAGVYGTKGIPSINNYPGSRNETDAAWVDDNNNLWLFGGYGQTNKISSGFLNDLWRYNIATDEWTWMSGDTLVNQQSIAGTQGVSSPSNHPGGRYVYSHWKDKNGNLWLLGRFGIGSTGAYNDLNDLWKYDIGSNEWTWMKGSTSSGSAVNGTKCTPAANNTPPVTVESRAHWTDDCSNFWFFSGSSMNLYRYSFANNAWAWINNGTNSNGEYGTQGVGSPTNYPSARWSGETYRISGKNEFYLFGGQKTAGGVANINDLWIYTADKPIASYSVNVNSGCVPLTVNFTNTSNPGCNEIKSYLWNLGDPSAGSANSSTISNPSFTYNSVGTYTVQLVVLNCTGSKDSVTGTITVNPCLGNPKVTLNGGAICYGNCMNLIASAASGTGPYTYSWMPNIGTGAGPYAVCPTITTIYTVTITDSGSLTATDTTKIIVNPKINIVLTTTDIECNITTGTIMTSTNGGTSPYTYLWTNNETLSSISNLSAGNYSLTITDSKGCSHTASTIITSISSPSLVISSTNILCNGISNGSATTTVTGGATPYTYLWSNNETKSTVTNLLAGDYTLIVTDNSGCSRITTVTITSSLNTTIVISVSSYSINCNGATTGGITTTLNGGTSPYTYNWSNNQSTSAITNLSAGFYTVTVNDKNGCSSLQTVSVNAPPPITVIHHSKSDTCNLAKGSVSITATGGTGIYSYLWNNGQTNNTIIWLSANSYSLTVTDDNGCSKVDVVIIGNESTADADAGMFVSIEKGESTVLNGTGTPASATFTWSPSLGLTNPNIKNPTASPAVTTTYTLTVVDENGCSKSDTVSVCIIIHCNADEIFIPNSFSPNNDGKNDFFIVRSNCIEKLSYSIYNRWGEKVFESTDVSKGWDGKFNGKTLDSGAFSYFIDATLITQEAYSKKGIIYLIK